MERVKLARGAFVLMGAALLIAGIHAAAVRGLADAHYTNARLTLAESARAKGGPRPEALVAAIASMRQALALEPANPHFVEQAARLQEMRLLGLQANDPALREGLKQSLARYREAALMRPGSPYVWAGIATLKLRLDEMDFEFYGALERAAKFGPWEPAVQLAIANMGLASWQYLARPAKAPVIAALERGLQRQETSIRRIAAAHGNLPPRLAALCVKK